ncbi:helix-turn-helix domain-containing protein [Wolbachia endosymbiont of Trichogramma pretiosum]|uniref:helix-turn-helix domain-containing protein n=1 Tax=Wolbachia endosymbiont of Trichogramma pretiosum TaxID=125593 RepID=UPI0008385250|nr:helix-turn-helix transcriptional regulator [Wolbachia endosymbiont of Trichogramma pretiosum]OCA06994.1 helix-turn-helix family protein [Wolbachia endosymbiont of Trichogramma pretiosum]
MELGKKIKELRLYCGFTQTELGKRTGVSYRQIQRYENGSNCILVSGLYDLAKALSIDVADFLTGIRTDSHEAYDEEILKLVKGYNKIKSKRLSSAVYILVKSFSQSILSGT